MLTGSSPFAKGKAILAASLTAMWDAIRAQRVTINPGGGLTSVQTPNGIQVSFNPSIDQIFATITTQCPAWSASSWQAGAGQLYQTAWDASGNGTQQILSGPPVKIYNPGNSAIASGKRVKVYLMSGRWIAGNEFC